MSNAIIVDDNEKKMNTVSLQEMSQQHKHSKFVL